MIKSLISASNVVDWRQVFSNYSILERRLSNRETDIDILVILAVQKSESDDIEIRIYLYSCSWPICWRFAKLSGSHETRRVPQ